ncbi:MAG: M48 family metallopeptidase [Candidatus Hodarchaeales archaeon]|jgi:Zn-dependent protease with chaperone function
MLAQNDILTVVFSLSAERIIAGIISIVLSIVFLLELRKYLKYRAYPDLLELSGIGVMATALFTLTNDVLLSGLAGILGIMLIGTFEVRENPIWVRMMGTFTISYGFFFLMVVIGFITSTAIPSLGDSILNFLVNTGFSSNIDVQQFFVGIGYNLIIYVMVFTALLVFGRKFIVVTRFISPQMTYLVLYMVAIFLLSQLQLPQIIKYPAIFVVNLLIYLFSGPLLTFLYAIKPLDDPRVATIIKDVQEKVPTPIRKIGIVKAPILNAFAFGPWFDQRIAYIASDLDQFTDEEIRGITAHELAHVQKKHTLILLGVTALELIIKLFIEAPPSYWDYVFFGKQNWDFVSLWLLNIILFPILLTFVKILEGQADKITREKGFGLELAESLFRLEGFYYGIAGEIGFNTQLMTGKSRSKDEEIRFMGDQAYYLYHNLAPSRMTCMMNLIASHPLTSIRIAMQIDKSIGAIKAGLMIWALLIPGLRNRTIKNLQKNHIELAKLLSEKYIRDFGTIEDYVEITYENEGGKQLVGQHVLVKPKLLSDTALWGKIVSFTITSNIVSPIEFDFEDSEGSTKKLNKGDYDFIPAEPKQKYFTKAGKIVTLEDVEIKGGKFKKFIFTYKNKKISSRSIGMSLSEFKNLNTWLLYKNGAIQSWKLKDVSVKESFQTSIFTMQDLDNNEHQFKGKELVIDIPPIVQMIKYRNWISEKAFFSRLSELGEPFILYDKEDFDIGAPTKILSVSDDSLEILEGRTSKNIAPNKLDALVLGYPFHTLNLKNEMGFGSLLSLKLFNREIQSKHIGL